LVRSINYLSFFFAFCISVRHPRFEFSPGAVFERTCFPPHGLLRLLFDLPKSRHYLLSLLEFFQTVFLFLFSGGLMSLSPCPLSTDCANVFLPKAGSTSRRAKYFGLLHVPTAHCHRFCSPPLCILLFLTPSRPGCKGMIQGQKGPQIRTFVFFHAESFDPCPEP